MKLSEDIRPVTYLKNKAADLLKQVNETRRPVVITQNGVARAVLQDPDSYEEMCETLAMMQLVLTGVQAVEEGRTVDHDTAMARLQERLRKHEKADNAA